MSRSPALFVPVHTDVWTHRKFLRLCRALKLDENTALGTLCRLWTGAISQTEVHGHLIGWDADDIAVAARWPGETQPFVDALVASGWLEVSLDGVYSLHGWSDYAGKASEERAADRARKAAQRSAQGGDGPFDQGGALEKTPQNNPSEEFPGNPPDVRGIPRESRGEEIRSEETREDQRRGEEIPAPLPPSVAKQQKPEPSQHGPAMSGVRARHAAVNARNLFAEPKPKTVEEMLAAVWTHRGGVIGEAWAKTYPDLWRDTGRKQTTLDLVMSYIHTSDANWTWPTNAVPKAEQILQKAQDEARRMAFSDAGAKARGVATPSDVDPSAPTDQVLADRAAFNAYSLEFVGTGIDCPPRAKWEAMGKPTTRGLAPAETPQRVKAAPRDPTLRPDADMTSEQVEANRAIMMAHIGPLTAKLTDRPETQQWAPQAAEKAIPQETEEAKAARRAKALEECTKVGWTPRSDR
jgi:hypothetical protein